jgi:uncharacterized alkaline shock family protein YloU
MNTMNRVLVVTLLLVAIPLCTVALILPATVLGLLEGQLDLIQYALTGVLPWARTLLGVLFAVILDIILILLVVLELRRPSSKAIRVEKESGGEVQVGVSSIAEGLEYEVDQLASVLRSKAAVSAMRGGVLIELDVETAAGVMVPEKASQIVATVQQVVEEQMGLRLARPPKVNLHTVPYPTKPKAAASAQPELLVTPED